MKDSHITVFLLIILAVVGALALAEASGGFCSQESLEETTLRLTRK